MKHCSMGPLVSLLGKKWMPHIIATFSERGTMSFGDCKRTFPYITDRVISTRLKELRSHDLLTLDRSKKYSPNEKLAKIHTILKELERIESI